MALLAKLKQRAKALEADSYALYLVARDPRTPWYVRLLVASVAAYAISPIDLIPDFIPLIGYLDDLILVPAGLALAVRLVPSDVLGDCRAKAAEATGDERPASIAVGVVVTGVWLVVLASLLVWVYLSLQHK